MTEPLDFCRVKKIDEKGYGFLKSLYYPGDVFFHFSQIKKEDFRDSLNKMKRGDFLIYFTSKVQPTGKRKADKIWYAIEKVDSELIPKFMERIAIEFETGTMNLYDLLFAYDELRKSGYETEALTGRIIKSEKVLKLPTTILPFLTADEIKALAGNLNFEELKNKEPKPFWYEDMAAALEKAG